MGADDKRRRPYAILDDAPSSDGSDSGNQRDVAPIPAETPQAADGYADEERHHVHHSYIWLNSIQTFLVVFFAVAVSMGSSLAGMIFEGEDLLDGSGFVFAIVGMATMVAVLLIVGLILLFHWWAYRHLYYTLDAAEFTLFQGIFNKRQTHVPYWRIQSVDQRATLLQRLFGVCSVNIDTAGGASNKAVLVPYITKTDAELLRRELFARKEAQASAEAAGRRSASDDGLADSAACQYANATTHMASEASSDEVAAVTSGSAAQVARVTGTAANAGNPLDGAQRIWDGIGNGVFAGSSVDTGHISYEISLSTKQLIYTGLSNSTSFGMIVLVVIGLILQIVSGAFEFFPSLADSAYQGMTAGHAIANPRLWLPVALSSAFGLAGIAFFIWIVSALVTYLRFGGFKARRRNDRIEVEHGLLSHIYQGVNVDRVQSVIVRQGFIRRLMGYCEVSLGRIDAAVQENSRSDNNAVQTRGMVIHPFIKTSAVPDMLDGLLPEYSDIPQEILSLAPVALRRGLVRRCIIQGAGFWLAAFITVALVLNAVLYPWVDLLPAYIVLYGIAAVLFIVSVWGTFLWNKDSGFGCTRRFMRIDVGGFSRESTSFLRNKIQFGYTKTNPLQRRAHTATLNARTAQGIGGTTVRLVDVKEDDARDWLDWLKPR